MRVIIGSYRERAYIERALESINRHIFGVEDVVVVDDSGNPENSEWLSGLDGINEVIPTGKVGYSKAMQVVCDAAEGEQFMFWEEDFTAIADVDLHDLSAILFDRPYLAQVALLRQPWFPIEVEHGGLVEALVAQGHEFPNVNGVLEQTATFTCNPSVWRADVAKQGWPQTRLSEETKRDRLLRQGYRFGFVEGIKVNHEGVRSGFGY